MPVQSSEQALSALEHSKKPAIDLLDVVAQILNLSWQSIQIAIKPNQISFSYSNDARFREQWVVRWLSKKLTQAVGQQDQRSKKQAGGDHSSLQQNEILQDLRTWDLLSYLLAVIPARVAQDLLVERNLCRTLNAAIEVILQRQDAVFGVSQHWGSPVPSDNGSVRPTKKRKLSSDQRANDTFSANNTGLSLVYQLLRIAAQCATICSASRDTDQLHSRSATQAWADNLEGATSLLGGIIRMAHIAMRETDYAQPHTSCGANEALLTVDQWLQLWHAYSSSGLPTSKQDLHNVFNTLVLAPALDLLQLKSKERNEGAFEGLERQIAIHAILPARTIFQRKFSATWTSKRNVLQEADVQRLVFEVDKILCSTTVELWRPNGGVRASLLLTISSRLIPRSDVVKRKAESAWLEALFLCLVHLTQKLPSSESELSEMHEDMPKHAVTNLPHIEKLIDALRSMDVVPSLPVWHYFTQNFVLAEETSASYALLAKVVKLNASVFTPESDATESPLLAAIDARIMGGTTRDKFEHDIIVHEVLSPILQQFGKSRQLTKFTTFWEAKLADTFHDRLAATATTPDTTRRYVWDDPGFLKNFSAIVRQHAAPSLYHDMLSQAQKDTESLSSIVGPSHRIFARITIATQVLAAAKRSSPMKVSMLGQLQPLANAIYLALGRSTDYQGHRWRLWSLLDISMQLDPKVDWVMLFQKGQVILPFSPYPSVDVQALSVPQRQATLMEQFSCLGTIATSFELNQVGVAPFLQKAIEMASKCTQNYVASRSTFSAVTCWDGTIECMGSPCVFLSAVFARLGAMPTSWLDGSEVPHAFLVAICTLVCTGEPTSLSNAPSVYTSAEALLSSILISTDIDLLSIFMEAVASEGGTSQVKRVPTLLHRLSTHHTSRKSTQKVVDSLLGGMNENGSLMDNSCLGDSLALVSDVSTKWPFYLEPKKSFNSCADGFFKSSVSADLVVVILTTQCTGRLAQALFTLRPSADGSTQWHKNIHAILKRIKKELKTQEGPELLNTYFGFFILATVRQMQHLQSINDDGELEQISSKIVKRFQEVALKGADHYLAGGSDVTLVFKASNLLDTLVGTAGKESLLKDRSDELRDLYPKLTEHILKLSPVATTPLETGVFKSVKERLDGLIASHGTIFGPSIPIAILAGDASQQTSRSSLETQAKMALDPAFSAPTTANASIVILVATGNEEAFKSKGISDDGKPLFAVTAIAKNTSSETLSTSPELIRAFGQVASLQNALHSWTPRGLLLRLELGKIILEKHSSIINQHIIDTTLSSITILATSACKLTLNLSEQPNNPHPNHIFDRLCAILTTLLIRYRRRLTGRHHLLLLALQALLKCLFYPPSRQKLSTNPGTSASKATFLSSLPHWLNPPTQSSSHTLPPTSATKFSRVLQTLCDPSASSARRATKRRHHDISDNRDLNLVDETRLLRRQVSQHTQYLLQTYCQTTLDGYISPEVKEKLMPGLYAVCNAMDMEVMKGMNSAMNESQRAVWKDLYGEWRRWGKWNQR